MTRQQDYYTLARTHARTLWEAIGELQSLQREWNALDYGNTLEPGTGANTGIVAADISSVVFDTTNAMLSLLAAGHATNLAKLL